MQNHQHQPTITPSAPPLPITTTTTTTTTETSAASTTIPAPPPYYESVTDPTPSTRQPENLTASLYNRLMQSSIQLPSCLSWCLWPCKICQKCQARHSLPLMTIKWRDIPSSTLDRFYISTHTHSYEQVGVTWLGYALAQFVALMFVWGFVSDGLTVASFIVNDRSVLAVAYSVLMVLNFGLFAVDAKRARAVIDSDGVAEAFVCQAAYNYYILRYGYRWFCVFEAVEGTRKPKHRLAFFVYFGLRGWGRLLFRDGLRIVLSLMAIIMAGAEQEPYRLVMFFVNIVLHGVFVARFFLALALWVPTKCIVRLRSLESYCCLIMNKNLMQLIQQDASTTSLQQQKASLVLLITLLCDDDTEYDEYRGATQSHKPGSEFLGKIRYRNPLPALPFAPKLLTPHLNTATTGGSTGTSEEASLDAVSAACAFSLRLWMKKMPQPLLCDAMCGMPLDLVDQDALTTGQSMDADDEALLQPVKTHTEERHRPLVPWLRRTEYISTETARVARTTVSSSPFHQQHQQHVYASPEEEWEAVDRSFEFSLANIKHPTRADLVPTEVLPVFPDFEMWPSSYVHCVFEDAPTNEQNFGEANARLCMDQSFLKAFTGSENTTAASTTGAAQQNLVPMIHYMPTPTALQHYHQQLQLEPDDGGSESQPALEAERAREYNGRLEIRDKHAPLDKMVVVFRPDAGGVFYAGVRGRVQLKKRRRQRGEKRQGDGRPTHLQVKRRELSTGEREQQALEVRHSLNIELPQQ